MIIKSTTWKAKNGHRPQFSKLINYLNRPLSDNEKTDIISDNRTDLLDDFELSYNFKSKTDKKGDRKKLINEFHHNDSFRKQRKNGVAIFHEILSFSKKDEQKIDSTILRDIALKYLSLRCKNSLAYVKAHTNHGRHKHLHFVISANQINSKNSNRISKKEFAQIKLDIESYQKDKYPQLSNSIVQKQLKPEQAIPERYTSQETKLLALELGLRSQRKISEIVLKALDDTHQDDAQSDKLKLFKQLLAKNDIELYLYRNKPQGVIFGGKKYRFSALDIDKNLILNLINDKNIEHINVEHIDMNAISKVEQRMNELNKSRDNVLNNNNLGIEL